MELLSWLPEGEREQKLSILKGMTAVEFPAAYFIKVPQSQHLRWVLLSPMNSEGKVVKTAPNFLIKGLIKTLNKYGQEYKTEIIQAGH